MRVSCNYGMRDNTDFGGGVKRLYVATQFWTFVAGVWRCRRVVGGDEKQGGVDGVRGE